MREKLVQEAQVLLADIPQDAAEELLQNTLDRYDEELGNGRSPKEAHDIALAALGDLDALRTKPNHRLGMRAAAICLYILSVVPVILFSVVRAVPETLGVAAMFLMLGAATTLLLCSGTWGLFPQGRRRALAIGLYVVCVIPVLLSSLQKSEVGEVIGVCAMFLIAAGATALLILNRGKPVAKPAPEERSMRIATRIFVGTFFTLAVIGFVTLSAVGYASLAWLLFPMAGAASQLLDGLSQRKWRQILHSLVWIFVLVIYFKLTRATEAWTVTWLVFPIGGCVNGVVDGIFTIIGGKR